jgi:hypothetical protein
MILPHDANPGRIKFSERTACPATDETLIAWSLRCAFIYSSTAATPQLVEADKPKRVGGLSDEQIALIEREFR